MSSLYILVGLGVIAGGIAGYCIGNDHDWKRALRSSDHSPMNFQDCVAAGNPVMESYPRQCRTQDGHHFVEDVSVTPTTPPSEETGSNDCVPAGCSGIICADADEAANIVSTCEYRADYACYTTAKCERQKTGTCGWTQTAELASCLKNPPSLE